MFITQFFLVGPLFCADLEEIDLEAGIPLKVQGFLKKNPLPDQEDSDIYNCKQLIFIQSPVTEEEFNKINAYKKAGILKYKDVLYYAAVTTPPVLLGVLSSLNYFNGLYVSIFAYPFSLAGQWGYSLLAKRFEAKANDYQDVISELKTRFSDMGMALARQILQNLREDEADISKIKLQDIYSIVDSLEEIRIYLLGQKVKEEEIEIILEPLHQLKILLYHPVAYTSMQRLLNPISREGINQDYDEVSRVITNEQLKHVFDNNLAPHIVKLTFDLKKYRNQ